MPLFPNRKCLLLFTSMGIHGCSFLAYNFLITTFCSCKRWPLQLIRRQLWELRVVCKGAGSLLLLPSSKILRVVHWHTWGIKVRGVPAPLKDLPMEMLGLTTFWKTLIFKVNRDPFSFTTTALARQQDPAYTPPVVPNCRNRPLSRGIWNGNPGREHSHSEAATPLHLNTAQLPRVCSGSTVKG